MKIFVLIVSIFMSFSIANAKTILDESESDYTLHYTLQGITITWQHGTASDIEDTALQTAKIKANVIRHGNGYILEGIYNSTEVDGCDLVSVEKRFDPGMGRKLFDTYNFVICNGKIVVQEESPLEFPTIPDGIVRSTVKNAQKYGHSEASYFDYMIKATALRDKDMCFVEVKVLKGISLLARWEANACK